MTSYSSRGLESIMKDYDRLAPEDLSRLLAGLEKLDEIFESLVGMDKRPAERDICIARNTTATLFQTILGADYVALMPAEPAVSPELGGIGREREDALTGRVSLLRREAIQRSGRSALQYGGLFDIGAGDLALYSAPIIYGDLPLGAVILGLRSEKGATLAAPSERQLFMMGKLLLHYDNRMSDAVSRLERSAPPPMDARRTEHLLPSPSSVANNARLHIARLPQAMFFGSTLSSNQIPDYLAMFQRVLNATIKGLESAQYYLIPIVVTTTPAGSPAAVESHLFVDIKSDGHPLNAQGAKAYHAYHRIYEGVHQLLPVPGLLSKLEPEEIPSGTTKFGALTTAAADKAHRASMSPFLRNVLMEMNDVTENLEVRSGGGREDPFAFHTANVGEVLAIIALAEYLTLNGSPVDRLLTQMNGYTVARQFLLGTAENFQIPEGRTYFDHVSTAFRSKLYLSMLTRDDRIPGFTRYVNAVLPHPQNGSI